MGGFSWMSEKQIKGVAELRLNGYEVDVKDLSDREKGFFRGVAFMMWVLDAIGSYDVGVKIFRCYDFSVGDFVLSEVLDDELEVVKAMMKGESK